MDYFSHCCDKTSDINNTREDDIFWLTVSEVGCSIACQDRDETETSWWWERVEEEVFTYGQQEAKRERDCNWVQPSKMPPVTYFLHRGPMT
jgi:hypothetical protein